MSVAFIIISYAVIALMFFTLGYFTAAVLGTAEESEAPSALQDLYDQLSREAETSGSPEEKNP